MVRQWFKRNLISYDNPLTWRNIHRGGSVTLTKFQVVLAAYALLRNPLGAVHLLLHRLPCFRNEPALRVTRATWYMQKHSCEFLPDRNKKITKEATSSWLEVERREKVEFFQEKFLRWSGDTRNCWITDGRGWYFRESDTSKWWIVLVAMWNVKLA